MPGSIIQSDLPGFEPPWQLPQRNVFFALIPNDSVRDAILAAGNAIADARGSIGRRLKRHRLHMTLLYLDALATIPESFLRHAIEAGDRIDVAPFDIALDVAGSFPNGDVPWWLGCSTAPSALIQLHKKLYLNSRAIGTKPRGSTTFTPHVTLSRANVETLAETSIAPIRWRVDAIHLIDSVFGTANFNIVKTWKLVGEPNA